MREVEGILGAREGVGSFGKSLDARLQSTLKYHTGRVRHASRVVVNLAYKAPEEDGVRIEKRIVHPRSVSVRAG
jgi:hypothetical protein